MKKQNKQKGFLSFIAILIIVVVSFIIAAAAYQFTTDSRTSANQLSSIRAFYLAQSGLEAAQHVIITNSNSCTSINGAANFTNAAFTGANGVYTVTGATTSASTTLNGNINASATTISLTSTSGFASSGVVLIDSEYMNYMGISGNSLTGVTRGVAGTTAAAHSTGASVVENQCALTSTGYVPNSTSPMGKRILQAIFPGSKTFSIGGYSARLFGAGSVSLAGNASIQNSSVTSSSSNFAGSTVVSSSNVVFNGSASTQVSDGSGGLVVSSSSKGGVNADVQQNSSSFNSSNLFTSFFGQSKATVKANSNQTYTNSKLKGATFQSAGKKVIWLSSGLNYSGNMTIGSAASPVIIVADSNVNVSGTLTIYGLLYVTQGMNLSGNVNIIGMSGVEGAVNTSGNVTISNNATVMNNLLSQSSLITATYKYVAPVASTQELLP